MEYLVSVGESTLLANPMVVPLSFDNTAPSPTSEASVVSIIRYASI